MAKLGLLVVATVALVAVPVGAGLPAAAGTPAPAAPANLALSRPATGSAPCARTEGPAKAVNGSVTGGLSDKFCTTAANGLLQVDLGAAVPIGSFVVRHAAAGGEPASLNTRDFDLAVSAD